MNRFFCNLTQSSKQSSFFLLKDQNVVFSGLNPQKIHTQSFSLAQNLGSYLESCYDRDSLAKVHSCVITQGLEKDTFLGSKLLNLYAKFNLLRESKWVFNKIICDDLSLWNSIIIGYFRAYQFDEVLGVYLSLRRRYIGLNNSAIAFLLTSCVQLGNYEFGRNVHSDALKFGLSSNHFVSSSFIGFYAKFDHISEAANVFDEIIERDVVAYTSLISGYARAGDLYANEGFRVVRDMQRHGFEPNRVTLVSLLQCASRLGSVKEGKSIQGYAIRRGLGCGDEIFETTLMDMYIKCGNLEMCTTIFVKMNRKSTASWNVLIAASLWLGQPLEALSHICHMVHEKYEVDLITLANGLMSCADLGHLLTGKSIHCYALRRGLNLDLICTTALVDMYSKCKHLSGAMNIFFRTEDKDSALFDVMISGYLYNGCISDAMVTFCEMITQRIKPYTSTIIRLVSKSSDFNDIKSRKSVHGYVFKLGFEASTDIANQFIDMYAKCGLIEHARLVFNRTKLKDRVSWTSLMTGLVNHGLADEAISLFREMQRRNINLDSVTFTCLLQALNSLGSLNFIREIHSQLYRIFLEKDVTLSNSLITAYSRYGKLNVASILFEQMTRRHQSTWNTMIAAYGMHGNCVKALELFDQMEKHNLIPDEVTFKSLLSSCSHAGFVREGLSIFKSMEEKYGISPSKEHYGCVVDLLGRAGRVNEAYDLVKHEPLLQNDSVLGALLAACRIHGYYEVGRMVGKWILEIDPCNKSAHCSVSNLFAGEEKWDEVAVIGAIAKGKGMKRTPGYSLIEVI